MAEAGVCICACCVKWREQFEALTTERDRLHNLISTPHTTDFLESVRLEAAHQRDRWGDQHDQMKDEHDWYWLFGWLIGKAVRTKKPKKRLHHIITTAAACLNWHRGLIEREGTQPTKG